MKKKQIIRKREKQPWKVDVYSEFSGKELHSHQVLSGAMIVGEKVIGGETYYHRDINQKVLIDKDEKGRSRL